MDCTRKHLAKAALLLQGELNYKNFWLSMANLSEAEEESVLEREDLANEIRCKIRLPAMLLYNEGDFNYTNAGWYSDACIRIIQDIEKGIVFEKTSAVYHHDLNKLNIAKASILLTESLLGYPTHRSLAIALLENVRDTVTGVVKLKLEAYIQKIKEDGRESCLPLIEWLP